MRRKRVGGKGQGRADHRHQRAFLQDVSSPTSGRRAAAAAIEGRLTVGVGGGFTGAAAGTGGGVGRGICMIGTLTTGNFGLLVLKLNSLAGPEGPGIPAGTPASR